MDFLKKASEIADEMLTTVNTAINRLNQTSRLYAPEDAKGMTAEVTVSIRDNGTGEVMLVLGQSLRNFPARAARAGASFARGEKVVIADVGPNVVYIDARNGATEADGQERQSTREDGNRQLNADDAKQQSLDSGIDQQSTTSQSRRSDGKRRNKRRK